MTYSNINDIDELVDNLANRLEKNVEAYHTNHIVVNSDDAKYSAYEVARSLADVDDEIGQEAVEYLRDNGL